VAEKLKSIKKSDIQPSIGVEYDTNGIPLSEAPALTATEKAMNLVADSASTTADRVRALSGAVVDLNTVTALNAKLNTDITLKSPVAVDRTPVGKSHQGSENKIAVLTEELALLRAQSRLSEDEIRTQTERVKLEKDLGVAKNEANVKALASIDILHRQMEVERKRLEWYKEFHQIGQSIGNTLVDTFMSIGRGSETFQSGMRKAVAAMIEMIAKALILKPIIDTMSRQLGQIGGELGGNSGGNASGGLWSLLGLNPGFGASKAAVGGDWGAGTSVSFGANGAAFWGGQQISAYASGGVFSKPTAFRHSGGLGVMGEAGPEAIMPLTMTSGGKLGVMAKGGGQGGGIQMHDNSQVIIQVDGDMTDQTTEKVRGIALQVIAEKRRYFVDDAVKGVQDKNRRDPSYLRR
jgi:phage-related minor tail protein